MFYREAFSLQRHGARWIFSSRRYHATAVESGEHLVRCLVYIDLNMVRAGVVRHPGEWGQSGYQEIQAPPERYSIIDLAALMDACEIRSVEALREAHRHWVNEALAVDIASREDRWSESVAVGSAAYIETVKRELDLRVRRRRVAARDGAFALREPGSAYEVILRDKNRSLRQGNAIYWR